MKKQKQNISASLGEAKESHQVKSEDFSQMQVNVNQRSNISTELSQNKRERDLETNDLGTFKKQRTESSNLKDELNNPNNISNNSTNSQSSMLNIINNSHTGNINVNVNLNNFMNPVNPYTNQCNDFYNSSAVYPGYNIANFTPNANSTYNIYQNLSYGMNGAYTSNYYNNPANKLLGNMNNLNYYGNNKLGMSNYYTSGSTLYDTGNQFILSKASQNVIKSGEKKKYVIQDMPGMTVGNYLLNKDTKNNYLSALQKKDGDELKSEQSPTEIKTNSSFVSNFSSKPAQNLLVVESKFVPPQLNQISVAKSVSSSSSLGNVISFNKPYNVQQVQPLQKQSNIINSPGMKTGEFSETLQVYIQRAYEKSKNEFDRQKCQKALMKIMSAALKKGDLNTRDWTKHPLPILPSELGQSEKSEVNDNEIKIREKRKGRFTSDHENYEGKQKETPKERSLEELTKNVVIVGTCQSLEKQYLRLTSIPEPSLIRPEAVLKKSLIMLKDKWKNKQGDYNYVSEQFRSIRQDMTIQHIRNEFTVKVYETHARIALESLDLDQFNQCQTALISLYASGIKGSNFEFLAYRIIYTILQGIKYDMENLLRDVKSMKAEVSRKMEVSHALKVMKAINTNNYFEFFNLFKITPNMGSYLIEPFLPRLRIKALQVASSGYFTEASVTFLSEKLAFETCDNFYKFLTENKIVLSNDKTKILFKESNNALNNSKLLTAMQVKPSNNY